MATKKISNSKSKSTSKSKSANQVNKKAIKETKKAVRKSPMAFIFLLLAAICAGVVSFFSYTYYVEPVIHKEKYRPEVIYSIPDSSPIEFHFLELGNANTGDSIYIKAGDNDILIDAGSRANSAETISSYLKQEGRVEDNKLEYVIATHAHQDHISGFYGVNNKSYESGKTGILYNFKVDNLIDFSYVDSKNGYVDNANPVDLDGTTAVYKNYLTARDYAVSNGTNWKTAGQLTTQGHNYTVELGANLRMEVLYNFFYDHKGNEITSLNDGNVKFSKSSFSSQNDYSVCVRFIQGENEMLFTGDAEEAAEYSLTKYNDLHKVKLFKAGHHGSYTASGDVLLEKIQPEMVCICCCAGNTEYTSNIVNTFPAQASIDRIAKYTNEVYVTTMGDMDDKDKYSSFNGNIVVSFIEKVRLECSNNNTKLKDTSWFKSNRTMPSQWQ